MTTLSATVSYGLSKLLDGRRRIYPQHTNRASSLDDPCIRRLYYMRAAWDKAQPIPLSLQGVFETGNVLEPLIGRIAAEAGEASSPKWRIVGSQMPTNDALLREHQITGTIDGLLQVHDIAEPQLPNYTGRWLTLGAIDIKTCSPNVYPRLNCYQDFSLYAWTKKWRGQVMVYSFAHNLEECFLLLVNKGNLYDMKLIQFGIDMAYLDNLLEKAKAVNAAIADNQAPAGINDHDACQRCAWFSYCCPPFQTGGNLQIVDDAELEGTLNRLAELSPVAKEYADLEKARDAMLVKGRDIVCGRFMVKWTQTASKQWRKKVIDMNAKQQVESAE